MSMNERQKRFVREYLKDKNATRSAKAAGYSKKTAYSIGQENLKKPEIAKAVAAGIAKQAEKADISAERVIKEIADIAFQKVNKNQMLKQSTNKLKALEHLGKHFQLFTDVVKKEVTATVTVVSPEQVKAALDELNNEV